jgi:signal transduction histidine kinase
MGAMAAGLAHEVRTPLSVIRASAEMLSRRMAAGSREGELASFVLEESDRLSRLVDDLLAYARPREPVAQPTDLATIADRAVRAQQIRGEAGKLEVQLESAPVSADPEQVYQVALNLLSNALLASPAQASVTIRTWRRGNDAMLEILDRGGGIPPEDLDRIWIPFFSRRAGGTGLGLPIVRRIVEAHRGSVTLEPGP